MSSINFHTKEISVKIVYYGPGLCGKTTSLQTVYASLPQDKRPQLVSLATEVDRTIFFDFLPVTAYKIRDFKVRLQLYTVPGQVFYNATRKLVLSGVDGIVFVADSQPSMRESNLESLHNLEENLSELGLSVDRVPLVLQYNKRDLGEICTIDEMNRTYNARGWPAFPTIARSGEGLFEALKAVSQMVVNDLIKKGLGRQLQAQGQAAATAPAQPPTTVVGAVQSAARSGPSPHVTPATFGASVEDAVSRATAAGSPAASLGLWPPGEPARLGESIELALKTARWVDVIALVEQVVQAQARRWQSSEGAGAEDDPVSAFLLLRGVSPTRYRALRDASKALRAGHAVGRSEAMSALVLALEVLW